MPSSKNVRQRFTESLSSSAKVDREAGVVRGVKLIGFESKNARHYPPNVLKASVHLYEGAKVNIDHPSNGDASATRSYGDRFGVIRNARFVESQGIFGDFHFNPKHAFAEQFCWDAENNPESVGFSHNATLKLGPLKNGKQVIEQIIDIRSMDLVADPATTSSLFESEYPTMDDAAVMDQPADPKTAMKGAFRSMIVAAVDDDSLDMKATIAKIKEIMKAQEKLMGGGSTDPEAEGNGTGSSTEEGTAFQVQIAALKQQLEQYQVKEKEAALLESINNALTAAGLDPKNKNHVSELFSNQLLATESEDDRKAMIADRATLVGARPTVEGQPGQPVYQPSTASATESIDAKSFASRLLV